MRRMCTAVLLAAFLALLPCARAQQAPKDLPPGSMPPMDETARINILKEMSAARVYVRTLFPQGKKGLVLDATTRRLTPDGTALAELVTDNGTAAKPGDLAVITNVDFRDRSIVFELNGGNHKKGHWYQHLQIGLGGGSISPGGSPDSGSRANALGSSLTLVFPRYVPQMSPHELRSLLLPVFDFDPHSAGDAFADSMPPKIRDAIKAHQVLVGMDRDMVLAAIGRPHDKIRENDEHGVPYEEWIYGEPPQDVQFVRFEGEEVVRLEIMKVDGTKIVRTQREVDRPAAQPAAASAESSSQPKAPPTLHRPGEVPADNSAPAPGGGPVLLPQGGGPTGTPPGTVPPGSPPGQLPPPNGPN